MGPPAQPSADTPAPQETSRLCVKNLPKYATEKRIKDHFAEKGLITDAKLVKTRCAEQCVVGWVVVWKGFWILEAHLCTIYH